MSKSTLLFLLFILLHSFVVAQENSENYLKLGGAVRFNVAAEHYEQSNSSLDSYIKTDTWYLSADAHQSGFDLSLQYRFYPDSKVHFLHHAYLGYRINDDWYAKLGVFQKPFGIEGTTAHSWWFQSPYYLGLEDTYNTGIGFTYDTDCFAIDGAYFRQAAPKGFMDSDGDNVVGNSRFSYAVVPIDSTQSYLGESADIRELDQFNFRFRYFVNEIVEVGASAQLGSIYNRILNKRDWGFTSALHAVLNYGRWNFKAEFIDYNYHASSDKNNKMDIIQMAAYGAAYDVASRGRIYAAGLSYTIPVERKFVKSIQTYVDYSVVDKKEDGYNNTTLLIPGVLITSGPILTYIDLAIGKNHPWLTSNFGQGLGRGSENAKWNARLNINMGYYF